MFCRHLELWTLPGKILMNLLATILATSVFFLISLSLLCQKRRRAAIFLQWLVFSEFSWMTVMSYELAHTMFRGSQLRKSES